MQHLYCQKRKRIEKQEEKTLGLLELQNFILTKSFLGYLLCCFRHVTSLLKMKETLNNTIMLQTNLLRYGLMVSNLHIWLLCKTISYGRKHQISDVLVIFTINIFGKFNGMGNYLRQLGKYVKVRKSRIDCCRAINNYTCIIRVKNE